MVNVPPQSLAWGRRSVPIRDITDVEMRRGWFRTTVTLRLASGSARKRRVPKTALHETVRKIEAARLAWWGRALVEGRDGLSLMNERLDALERAERHCGRSRFTALCADAGRLAADFPDSWPDAMAEAKRDRRRLERIRVFLLAPDRHRERANDAYLRTELQRFAQYFDAVEKLPLTDEQRRAVVVDDDRNLVVAAAGSGKTSVMVAKAGWLLRSGRRHPNEMLLLAFAREARNELEQRVRQRLGAEAAQGMTVSTFHELALSIIGEAEGRRPSVARTASDRKALAQRLNAIVADLVAEGRHAKALLRWFSNSAAPYRSQHEFNTMAEYLAYLRSHEVRSLQGDLVKSLEECAIANFLFANGVNYEYEAAYEHDTATPRHQQYRPDFRLPDHGIYIEHFALSADGRTPPFIDNRKYNEERQWKLRLHERWGTTLVETFSHEQADGRLTERLEAKLQAHGVAFNPRPASELLDKVNAMGLVRPFIKLVATFLGHFKGARLTMDDLERAAAKLKDPGRAKSFLRAFAPIAERYERQLADAGEIDFEDMINRAADAIADGRWPSPYAYILVDEFQDISPGRAALLKSLLDQSDGAQLFAVGDDWQAIFRFAGSDVALMRDFHERFGEGARLDLTRTFRCSEGINDVATRFILENTSQLKKTVGSVSV